MTGLLNGKNCVVTAGSGGIGKGIVRSFLKEGAFVFFSGRSAKTVNPVVQEFLEEGFDKLQGVVADVSTKAGTEKFFETVSESGKDIDVLVNNMGVFDTGDFFEYTDEQ
eukprot:gene42179-52296_t